MSNQQNTRIPYGRQTIEQSDIDAVVSALRSDWLTTGPALENFEKDFAEFTSAKYAVAVNSGTAALHSALHSLEIGKGSEVLVPAITFAATANAVVYLGGTPVFVDVDPDTLLIDVDHAESLINPLTRAIIAVDFAGQPCNYRSLRNLCDNHRLDLVVAACHSLGATYHDRKVGTCGDLNCFSFHPVKAMTTGEGGMVTTDNRSLAKLARNFRNHGIKQDFRQREQKVQWEYDIEEPGMNYRISDFQCALGNSQLKRLPNWIERRNQIANCYREAFAESEIIQPLSQNQNATNAYHLFVVQLNGNCENFRATVFELMRNAGINVNVHYRPVYHHTFYRKQFGYQKGLCPNAESAYSRILSLPIFPAMTHEEVDRVIAELKLAVEMAGSKTSSESRPKAA